MARHPSVQQLILLSAAGTSGDVLGCIEDINAVELRFDAIGFLDDAPAKAGTNFCGLPVLGTLADFTEFPDAMFVNCLGSSSNYWKRGRIVESLGIPADRFATLVHPSAVVSRQCVLGTGTIVYPFVFIGSEVRIGRQSLVMSHASINHGVTVGDYAIVASMVALLGDVTLGAHCYVGAGATVRQGRTVGVGSLVGMGSAVVADVAPNTVVMGIPARHARVANPVSD